MNMNLISNLSVPVNYDIVGDYTFDIPIYSEVIDANIDNGTLSLLFTHSGDSETKSVYVKIVNFHEEFTLFNYRFLKSLKNYRVDTSTYSNGSSVDFHSILSEDSFICLVDENKQINELRDEKIDKIL